MPFTYQLPVPDLPDINDLRLTSWLLEIRSPVGAGVPVAVIGNATRRFQVLANGEGFLWEKLVPEGAKLKIGQHIAMIAADGENIPYGKPYSMAKETADEP